MIRQAFPAKKVFGSSAPQAFRRGNCAKLRAGRVLSGQAIARPATALFQSAFGYSENRLYVPAQGFAPRPLWARCAGPLN